MCREMNRLGLLFLSVVIGWLILFVSGGSAREKRDTWWSFPEMFKRKEAPEEKESRWIQKLFIDPGHGGSDPGAVGISGLKEKDVTLAVATALLEKARDSRSGIEVLLSRDDDYNVTLMERAAMANRAEADIFVSLHTNQSPRHQVKGMDVYFYDHQLRLHPSEENGGERRGGGNMVDILWEEAQLPYQSESIRVATILSRDLWRDLGSAVRGVRGAKIFLLQGVRMPAMLVELGFLSNVAEENTMVRQEWVNGVAEALFTSVVEYDSELRGAQ